MKSLIIDDERIARQELRRLLTAHSSVKIEGEARNGQEALILVGRVVPDLVFLDIHMPGMNAFEFLERLDDVPQVIFTTAFDSYALRAFDVGAVDYLVKPISPERLAMALRRLKPINTAQCLSQVFVKDNNRCWLVQVPDIYLLESEGNYTRLYFGKERPLILRSLVALQARLDPAVFFRTGRSHIINLKWVQNVEPTVGNGFLITLRGGLKIEMSRRRSTEFRDILGL
jgi:two-component system LytT family response regulator